MNDFFQSRWYSVICWSAFGLWFVTINILSSIPASEIPPVFHWQFGDKIVHLVIFVSGAFLLATAWCSSRSGTPLIRFVIVFILLLALGIVDEFHQLFVPGRSGLDWSDMLANLLGSLLGTAVAFVLHRYFLPERKPAL